MPKRRKKYTNDGKPQPCAVTVSANLAKYLYRECSQSDKYKDETELVNSIVRRWAESQDAVNWDELYKQLKAEDEAAARAGLPDAGSGSGKKKPPKPGE